MATKTPEQQIYELVQNHSSVLLCLPEHPNTDAIASGLALLHVMEKMGKRARVVSSGFQLPQNHGFLPKSDEIFDDIPSLRQFVISVDVSRTSVESLSYDISDEKLQIYLAPKDGYFRQKDVTTSDGDYAFDLIITIDVQDMDQLGKVYDMNADFFLHTPLIAIDNDASSQDFAQVRLQQVTATSVSEIVFELLETWEGEHVDEYIATSLLTGMISRTKSFQSGSVTPRSLAIASHLISQGARRDDIVRHLYQSKDISTLKLWGRVLSKLEIDEEHSIVWSMVTQKDFDSAGASDASLPDVIDELIVNTPEAKHVFVLYGITDDEIGVLLSTASYVQAKELFAEFTPSGTDHFVRFTVNGRSMHQLKELVTERLRSVHAG